MYNEINYVLTDTPSAGLTINASSVKVNGEEGNPYISVADNVLTFTLKKNADENTIHDYLNQTIEITYTATVNADAVESNEFNNSVILNYTNAPGEEKSTREKETHLYTYDIDGKVQKVDENHQPLAGATFTLYIDEDCKTPFQYVGQGALTWTTTEDNNDIEFKDLPAGTYYIQETAAPGGYKLNGKKFKVTIEPVKNDVGEPTADAVVTVTDMDHNNDVVTEIINTKLSTLPSTGGMGTYVFTIVGVVIMAGAAGLLIAKRRRDA